MNTHAEPNICMFTTCYMLLRFQLLLRQTVYVHPQVRASASAINLLASTDGGCAALCSQMLVIVAYSFLCFVMVMRVQCKPNGGIFTITFLRDTLRWVCQ